MEVPHNFGHNCYSHDHFLVYSHLHMIVNSHIIVIAYHSVIAYILVFGYHSG